MNQNKGRGPLIKVQLGPHRYAKMYEMDAIEKGLIPKPGRLPSDKGEKSRSQAENKMIKPEENKGEIGQEKTVPDRVEWEDFTEIQGIGRASCSALYDNGVHTWEDLLDADVSFLNPKARAAVVAWRETLTPSSSPTIGEGSKEE